MQVLPHLEKCMFPAAEQKPETATGRRRKRALLSLPNCLDKPIFLLQHPFPSQAIGLVARRLQGSQLCLQSCSHAHTSDWAEEQRCWETQAQHTPAWPPCVTYQAWCADTRFRMCHHHDRNLLHSLQFSPWTDELIPAALPQVMDQANAH